MILEHQQIFRPGDQAEARDIVAWAADAKAPLAITGAGSKSSLGYTVESGHGLDLTGLTGILDYEPSELFVTARAGTPLAQITDLLSRHDQMLAFEPCHWAVLSGRPTLGGTVACNIAGPRRLTAGAARDHFLGYSAINGRGEFYKAGAKVVKNVTGYDLCKLMAGAMGTLSVLTEITLKVLPNPETSCTLAALGLDAHAGIALLAQALNGPNEVPAAAHVPADVAHLSPVQAVSGAGAAITALRLEGPAPSVKFRLDAVRQLIGGEALLLDHEDSMAFWRDIGTARCLAQAMPADAALWRICTTPSLAPDLAAAVGPATLMYDWAGGLLWLASEAADGGASAIRAGIARHGGHATLLRASASLRETVPLFQPVAPVLERLNRRVKLGFDPLGILNPGRMVRGL